MAREKFKKIKRKSFAYEHDLDLCNKQRIKFGICDSDSCSLDTHLATIIHNGLIDLYRRNVCYPNELTAKKWDKILTRAINDFKILSLKFDTEDEDLIEAHKRAMKFLKRYWFNLWD